MASAWRVGVPGIKQLGHRSSRALKSPQFLVVIVLLMLLTPATFRVVKSYIPRETKQHVKDRIVVFRDYLADRPFARAVLYAFNGKDNYPRLGTELGDGGPPLEAVLYDPTGIYVDHMGNVFVSERRHFRIRKIVGGIITTVAGNGRQGFSGDGLPGPRAKLNRPEGLDGDSAGNLYVADSFNHRVRRIAPDGTITTIAGTGEPGFSGDGGPATAAQLHSPMDVKLGPAGSLYVVERDNHTVRRISARGTITTVAGTGEAGFSGDGGIGTEAQLNEPYGIAVDRDGNIYVADSGNHRVRKISTEGIITTVAGIGTPGYSGDGGMANRAELNSPQAVLVTAGNELIINDEHNYRIRRVRASGIIETIAGTGEPGFSGDGGPASEARLADPEYLWMDTAGNLYLTDGDNNRVRKVDRAGIISTIAGGGDVRYR